MAGSAQAALNPDCPWVGSRAPIGSRVQQVLARMSLDDEIALVHGTGGSAYTGFVPGNDALCIPALKLQDGPTGVRMADTTQLPSATTLAATFDQRAARRYGSVIGAEDRTKGIDVDLGPTVNIVRDPRWGRSFESYSEDPYLTGKIGTGDIEGIQSHGVMAQVKHWAVYNQETNRNSVDDDVQIDDRSVHEIYAAAFGTIVDEAKPSSAMCSYSMVNGSFACENAYLDQILKQDFGFDGFITSDWGGTHSTVGSANAGMDMEMPRGSHFGAALKQAVTDGQVPRSRLDDMVSRILRQEFRFGLFDHPSADTPTAPASTAAHVATARQISEDGTVLLKNDGVLPLNDKKLDSIAVIGDGAGPDTMTAGGGSRLLIDGKQVIDNWRDQAAHTETAQVTLTANEPVSIEVDYYQAAGDAVVDLGWTLPDSDPLAQAVQVAKDSDVAVVYANDYESEGSDLKNIDLPGTQNAMIDAIAAANPNTIVVLNTGSAVTMPWLSKVKGVFEAWYPGQDAGNAIAALLFGDADPSGKLPVTFPTSLDQVPAATAAQWPGVGGTVSYSEGLRVGYRWYDAQGLTPAFPFGYGLSYTSFRLSRLHLSGHTLDAHRRLTVSVSVTNTGHRSGDQVVQLYLSDPKAAGEPSAQLKGFAKVSLRPGQTKRVNLHLTAADASVWSSDAHAWQLTPGTYTVHVGDSSTHLPLSSTFTVRD